MATRKNDRTGGSDKTGSESEGTLPETPNSIEETASDSATSETPAADSPDPARDAPEAREAEAPVSASEAPASESMEVEIDPDRPAEAPGEIESAEPKPFGADAADTIGSDRAEAVDEGAAARSSEAQEDYAEEEHGSSFASKALTALVLLLAGAGLGIGRLTQLEDFGGAGARDPDLPHGRESRR